MLTTAFTKINRTSRTPATRRWRRAPSHRRHFFNMNDLRLQRLGLRRFDTARHPLSSVRVDFSSPISLNMTVEESLPAAYYSSRSRMRKARPDIANTRREQIVEAAVAVITEQGLQNLSLSEIEQKAGMSRGQLTYYFKAKEDIL